MARSIMSHRAVRRRKIAAVIEAQRQQLFRASAVVDMCRFACASKFTGFDPEQMADALRVVSDLIGDAAGALEGPAEQVSAGGAA